MENIRLPFTTWLTMHNPLTRLKITTAYGMIYEGKKLDDGSFDMRLAGFDVTKALSHDPR